MRKIQATNDFVITKPIEAIKETAGGLTIPTSGKIKPNKGTVISVGDLVDDKKIKANKDVIWHGTVGFGLKIEGEDYWVLTGREVIAVL